MGGGARGARRARAARRPGARRARRARRWSTILGNLAGVRTWISAADPPKDYAWFDPSRVIPNTINEFPSFSFVLGDLHAHVIALPFTVLALAFALQVALRGPRGDLLWRARRRGAGGRRSRSARCTRSTRGRTRSRAGLLAAAVSSGCAPTSAGRRGYPLVWLGLVLVASFVLILPFVLNFDPEARGIGFVARRAGPFGKWLGDMALIYGILLWPLVGAVRRAGCSSSPNRWRWLGWGLAAAVVVRARCWRPTNLTGALVAGRSGWRSGIGAALVAASSSAPQRFLWILIAGGAALLLIPELLYLRDAFDGSAAVSHEHRLQGRLPGVPAARPRRGLRAAVGGGVAAAARLAGLGGGRRDPAPARARLPLRGQLRAHRRLRQRAVAERPEVAGGAAPRATRARSTGCATHTPGDAVVLEAFGDDYSAFGHGRISTFTGRPTVIGWAGPRAPVAARPRLARRRRQDALHDAGRARPRTLIARYGISYVVVGPIEQTTYGDAGLAKWDQLGRQVYSSRRHDGLGARRPRRPFLM